ncbi:hypothetical protein BXU08_15585 [Sphingomonas sp. LM7]|nr:hypothetical protein BXU08_15585 [Sphingomonas sp. LM7]
MALPLPLLPATAARARQQTVPAFAAPDFSTITTRAEAARLARKHVLVRIQFFPTELGGPKSKVNTGYVTLEAAASHARLVEMLAAYAERGRIDRLEIVPEYKGASVIPNRIRMTATHSRTGERHERSIEIWDCGFCPPLDPLPDPDGVRDVTA